MSVMEQPLEYRRLAAPRENRGLLFDPPPADVGSLVARNRALQSELYADFDMQGRTIGQLSAQAREQLLHAAVEYTRSYRTVSDLPAAAAQQPIFLAGHQPNLFHPGVWCKNFVLGHLAQQAGATAVNLVIDSDAVKRTSIRVPGGTTKRPTLTTVAYDTPPATNTPYEEYKVADHDRFNSFAEHVTETIAPLVADPMVDELWPRVQQRAKATDGLLGLSLAQARHQTEGAWGLQTLELPQSTVCQLESFHYFTAHLLAHLPRFTEVYNDAVHEYRRVHKIRGTAHPVPDLAAEGSYLEAPFWIWDTNDRERRHLFVCQEGETLRLTDRANIDVQLSATAEGDLDLAVEQLAALAASGIKIRTRALLTTMFSRMFLGDLFIHGIGGAKYDALTDLLIRRFFGLTPPEFVTLSATLQLPIEREQHTIDDVREVQRQLRDLTYHPETVLEREQVEADAALKSHVEAKQLGVQTPSTAENCRARHEAITAANEALQPHVEERRNLLLQKQKELQSSVRNARILGSREYETCLFSATLLQDFLLDYLPARV